MTPSVQRGEADLVARLATDGSSFSDDEKLALTRLAFHCMTGAQLTAESAKAILAILTRYSGNQKDAATEITRLRDALAEALEWVELGPDLPAISTADEYEARALANRIRAILSPESK